MRKNFQQMVDEEIERIQSLDGEIAAILTGSPGPSYLPGAIATCTVVVENTGVVGFVPRVYLETIDEPITLYSRILWSATKVGTTLAPGARQTIVFTFTVPATPLYASYFSGVHLYDDATGIKLDYNVLSGAFTIVKPVSVGKIVSQTWA